MGLGSTAKKVQKLADRAEELYEKLSALQERVKHVEESSTETVERVREIETELERQRALLEALAEAENIDADAVIADASIEDVTAEGDESATPDGGEST